MPGPSRLHTRVPTISQTAHFNVLHHAIPTVLQGSAAKIKMLSSGGVLARYVGDLYRLRGTLPIEALFTYGGVLCLGRGS